MKINISQISSLDKIFDKNTRSCTELSYQKVLKGERFSYQLNITGDECKFVTVSVDSKLKDYIKVYRELPACCDFPIHNEEHLKDDNYLTCEPSLIPDILTPIEASRERIRICPLPCLLWIRTDIPDSTPAGVYDITINFSDGEEILSQAKMTVEVLDLTLPKPDLKYTQWFYADCISSYYNAEIYSERHWELIDSFIENAADCGINMILSPVHNPSLDTAPGLERPNVQLTEISKTDSGYSFDFSKFERWVSICRKHGIVYYEIPHFFSQWGSKYAPNIYVDGVHMFGIHTSRDSKEYVEFLSQYIPALTAELKKLGIYDNTYFHISDEPNLDSIDTYKQCYDIITGIDSSLNLIDALSDADFYKKGLIKIPIPSSNCIEPFLDENIDELWTYYCCIQGKDVSNRFLAMSSFRNRIIGIQMYKFGIKGFLHWGYNFYFSQFSEYDIDPYTTTSADRTFPSGDTFSVYPGKNGALPSMRAFVFYEALQDIALCKLLEDKTSHKHVVSIIDELAGIDVRFSAIPKNENYLFALRERILSELEAK